ncbi:MAG: IgGFc-binding protein [Pseudomonadota bacterium]
MMRWMGCLTVCAALLACQPTEPPQPVDACGGKCSDTQVCLGGECKDQICTPFATSCLDASTLSTCNGNGTAKMDEPCPGGTACMSGTCAPTICVPLSHFCGGDGERKLCSATGLDYSSDPCGSGTGCTGVGECVPQICTPGAVTECISEGTRQVRRCSPAGTAIFDDQCRTDQVCVGDACQQVVCTEGRKFCVDSDTIADCGTYGTAASNPVDCNTAQGAVCVTDSTHADGALCATACDLAAVTKSYIACDYRFAITDNNIDSDLGAGSDPFPAAVVVANTSDQDVHLTLSGPSGNALTLPPMRHVTDRAPGGSGTPQDVHSKISVGSNATNVDSQSAADLTLPAGGIATLLLPNDIAHGSGVFDKSYHLVASLPVSAYLFNPICCNFAYTNDASLLIPTTAWRQAYFVVSGPHRTWSAGFLGMQQNEAASAPAGLAVVAAEDGTRIAVRKRPGQASNDFKIENGLPNFGNDSSYPEELRLTLNANQVFQLMTAYKTSAPDPTGVLVAADKPIGVFGLHECAYIPEKKEACDHMEEMLLPIETWGTEYIGAMPKMRNTATGATNQERMYYRFVSSAATNRIQVLPKPGDVAAAHAASTPTCPMASDGSFILNEGGYCEFGSKDSFRIMAQAPILVGAIFAGQEATGLNSYGSHAGDPALSQLIPVEQYRYDYSFLTPDTYYVDYVTVVYNTNSSILLDGAATVPGIACVAGANTNCLAEAPVAIAGTSYMRMTLRLARGAHTMSSVLTANPQARGERFGIFNYGYDDYVSYAYPGGLDLVQTSTYPNMPAFP